MLILHFSTGRQMYFVGGLVFYGDSMGTKASVTETCIASCCLLVVAILKYLLCLSAGFSSLFSK